MDKKRLYIDAIVGLGFPSMEIANEMQQAGYAVFTGNQHNVSWEWKRSMLKTMTTRALMETYVNLTKLQDINRSKFDLP